MKLHEYASMQDQEGEISTQWKTLRSAAEPDAETQIQHAKQLLERTYSQGKKVAADAINQSKLLAHHADDYVHQSPWHIALGGLAVGIIMGMVIFRR